MILASIDEKYERPGARRPYYIQKESALWPKEKMTELKSLFGQ
jgi:hypothetical protein